ncbi:MAG TPA: assimilatory sulfite reductase (NADPH) flavoprotein subunit [Woeseiaceae bacterium]|nr:assimilatory sulfite reductase (NADPH) flavoprotein subunit [Woeseiaceae bacterium]
MAAVPNPDITPPLPGEDLQVLRAAVAKFDYDQLLWASGYLAGLARATLTGAVPAEEAGQSATAETWNVFYATETGNSRRVAESLVERARSAGLDAQLQDLRDYKPKALTKVANAVFVVATHGIGEPPDGSEAFFEFWLGERAPRLESLNYSVLALGDSSYADFCAMGQVFDERLRALGATAVVDRVDCDLDFDSPAADWAERVVSRASETAKPQVSTGTRPARLHAVPKQTVPTRERPFTAEILLNQPITGRGSSKDVRHIELDLESSGITYLPGDSLGVLPKNPPQLVEAVLEAVKLGAADEVTLNGEQVALADALSEHREITVINRPLLETVAGLHDELRQVLSDRTRLTGFFGTRQVIDLLADYPKPWTAQELVDSLRRLTPRLYSIASSPDANPGEAHLTVGVVRYEEFGRPHWGAASSFLADGAGEVPVFLEPNDRFRLPDDGDAPIVMIGAGTGVAPYRAFVEHRLEHGHKGDNWLVFGERQLATDFLYQLEWLRYRRDGVLTRLDVAFSRDQAEKIYVQHRLREQSRVLFEWLERGAHVYVCGDAERMAGDVHQALVEIVQKEGGMTGERAQEYVGNLKAARRYQRDVY